MDYDDSLTDFEPQKTYSIPKHHVVSKKGQKGKKKILQKKTCLSESQNSKRLKLDADFPGSQQESALSQGSVSSSCVLEQSSSVKSVLPESSPLASEICGKGDDVFVVSAEDLASDSAIPANETNGGVQPSSSCNSTEDKENFICIPEMSLDSVWLCVVCRKPIPEQQRTVHLSECIRSFEHCPIQKASEAVSDEMESPITCLVCNVDISYMSLVEQTDHVNRCLDSSEGTVTDENSTRHNENSTTTAASSYVITECPICFKNCVTAEARFLHIKKCSRAKGLSVQNTISALQLQAQHAAERIALGLPLVQAKLPAPRLGSKALKGHAKQPRSQADADLQLAKALSLSIEEERKQNCSDVEEMEVVEDDHYVPVHLRPPGPGQRPGKKARRKAQKHVPFLVLQTDESRRKLLEERVSAIIASSTSLPQKESDENITGSGARHFSDDLAHSSSNMECRLWCLCGLSAEKLDYYVSELMEFITPSEVEAGSKLRNLSQIPGHQICTQKPCDFTFSEKQDDKARDRQSSSCPIPTTQEMVDVMLSQMGKAESASQSANNMSEVKKRELQRRNEDDEDGGFVGEENALLHKAHPVIDCLESLVGNMWMSDVDISVSNGETIPAHKLLLLLRCPSLREELDASDKHLHLNWSNVSRDGAWHFLNYVYTGTKSWPLFVEDEVLMLAARCGVKNYSELCEQSKEDQFSDNKGATCRQVILVDGPSNTCDKVDEPLEDNISVSDLNPHCSDIPGKVNTMKLKLCEENMGLPDLHSNDECATVIDENSDESHFSASHTVYVRESTSHRLSDEMVINEELSTVVCSTSAMECYPEHMYNSSPDLFVCDSDDLDSSITEKTHSVESKPGDSTMSLQRAVNSAIISSPEQAKCSSCAPISADKTAIFRPSEVAGAASCRKCSTVCVCYNSENYATSLSGDLHLESSRSSQNSLCGIRRQNQFPNGGTTAELCVSLDSENDLCDLRNSIDRSATLSKNEADVNENRCDDLCILEESLSEHKSSSDWSASHISESLGKKCMSTHESDMIHECETVTCCVTSTDALPGGPKFTDSCSQHVHNISTENTVSIKNQFCSSQKTTANRSADFLVNKVDMHNDTDSHLEEIHCLSPSPELIQANCSGMSCLSPILLSSDSEDHCIANVEGQQQEEGNFRGAEFSSPEQSKRLKSVPLEGVAEDKKSWSSQNESLLRKGSSTDYSYPALSSDVMEDSEELLPLLERIGSSRESSKGSGISQEASTACITIDGGGTSEIPSITQRCKYNKIDASSSKTSSLLAVIDAKMSDSPVTPMPDYTAMVTPEIKHALRKFGIRPLPRKKAVALLTHIYDETHPWIEVESVSGKQEVDISASTVFSCSAPPTRRCRNDPPIKEKSSKGTKQCKRKRPDRAASSKNSSLLNKIEDVPQDVHSSSQTSSQSDFSDMPEESIMALKNEDEDEVTSSQQYQQGCVQSIVGNYIQQNKKLYSKVLMYEPLDLMEFHGKLQNEGIRVKVSDLMDFLDKQCITYTVPRSENYKKKQQARTQRFRKRMIAKLSQDPASLPNSQ